MFTVEVTPTGSGNQFTQEFKGQINAEIYMYRIAGLEYVVTPQFEPKFTEAEIVDEFNRQTRLGKEASRLQNQALDRSGRNYINPDWNPCEICGKKHGNYNCCEGCNYNTHRCHFCGDDLGHSEVSACYILEGLGD